MWQLNFSAMSEVLCKLNKLGKILCLVQIVGRVATVGHLIITYLKFGKEKASLLFKNDDAVDLNFPSIMLKN